MSALLFRRAAISDIAAAHALIEGAFRSDSAKSGWTHEADLLGGQRTDVEALRIIIGDPTQALILAEQDDALCGCVLVVDKGPRERERVAYLGMLTVSPQLQGGGLGRTLVTEAERCARETFGATCMEMTVIKQRAELVDWYLRRGYALTGREEPFPLDEPRFGIPKTRELVFVVMAKAL